MLSATVYVQIQAAPLLDSAQDIESADIVIALVNSLESPLTLDAEFDVQAARDAYDALTAAQKELVSNYALLLEAEDSIFRQYGRVHDMFIMIDTITCPVSLIDKDDVIAARERYELLDEAQKARVTNYSTLVDAEVMIFNLEKVAFDVVDLINAFPAMVTMAQMPQVQAARVAYTRLNNRQKALVSNYNKLVEAEAKIVDCLIALDMTNRIDDLPNEFVSGNYQVIVSINQDLSNLTPAQYEKVDTGLLAKLSVQYAAALNYEAANSVIELLASLPESVSTTNIQQVQVARTAYNALTTQQAQLVPSELVNRLAQLELSLNTPNNDSPSSLWVW
ncbi:MAG: hypothetical protein U1C59_00395, partial [Methylotenera sp.]|nr:hypothetical protein [Methylotenera sp.]